MNTEVVEKHKINLFAFPTETEVRFRFLVVAAFLICFQVWGLISVTVFVYGLSITDYKTVNDPYETIVDQFRQQKYRYLWFDPGISYSSTDINESLLDSRENFIDDLQLQLRMIRAAFGRLSLELATPLIMVFAAWLIYRYSPIFVRALKRYRPFTYEQDTPLHSAISESCRHASETLTPEVEISNSYTNIDAQVFGTKNRYVIGLSWSMRFLVRKKRETFKAIILHEIAHIINKDISQTYFALSVFCSTFLFTFIPFLYISIWAKISIGTPVEKIIINYSRAAITFLVLYAILAGLIKTRELYADWRVTLWGYKGELQKIFEDHIGKRKKIIWEILGLHPSSIARLDSLNEPQLLTKIKNDLPLITGILAGYVFGGLESSSSELNPLIGAIVSLIHSNVYISFIDFSLQSNYFSPFITNFLYYIDHFFFVVGYWVMYYLIWSLPAFLIANTLGVEVQRSIILGWVNRKQRQYSALRLLFFAFLVAFGMEFGHFTAFFSVYYQNDYWYSNLQLFAFELTSSIVVAILIMWIWLISLRRMTIIVFGSYIGSAPPTLRQKIFNFCSAIWLFILYVPWQSIRRAPLIGVSEYQTQVNFTQLFICIILAVLLAIFASVIVLFFKLLKVVKPSTCPVCNQPVKSTNFIDKTCGNCNYNLSSWRYVQQDQ